MSRIKLRFQDYVNDKENNIIDCTIQPMDRSLAAVSKVQNPTQQSWLICMTMLTCCLSHLHNIDLNFT